MPIEFNIRLTLPDRGQPTGKSNVSPLLDIADFIDDDPTHPLFLVEACSVFATNGVCFEIKGFVKEPLPVSTADDLVYLLENVPSLFKFFEDNSSDEFSLDFLGQGIETVYSFLKLGNGHIVQVSYSSSIDRAMEIRTQKIPCNKLVEQTVVLVETYCEALKRYLPRVLDDPWNQGVFATARRLKNKLRGND